MYIQCGVTRKMPVSPPEITSLQNNSNNIPESGKVSTPDGCYQLNTLMAEGTAINKVSIQTPIEERI